MKSFGRRWQVSTSKPDQTLLSVKGSHKSHTYYVNVNAVRLHRVNTSSCERRILNVDRSSAKRSPPHDRVGDRHTLSSVRVRIARAARLNVNGARRQRSVDRRRFPVQQIDWRQTRTDRRINIIKQHPEKHRYVSETITGSTNSLGR